MQVRELLQNDDAVSPVIGVILMVAITVILAAVIASFVLGLGGSQQQTPQASFSWDYDETADGTDNNNTGIATISHDSGDTIPAQELVVQGSGLTPINVTSVDIVSAGENWPADEASGSQGDASAVTGGDTVEVGAQSDFELSLVWRPQEGDTSATLSEETGPDA